MSAKCGEPGENVSPTCSISSAFANGEVPPEFLNTILNTASGAADIDTLVTSVLAPPLPVAIGARRLPGGAPARKRDLGPHLQTEVGPAPKELS